MSQQKGADLDVKDGQSGESLKELAEQFGYTEHIEEALVSPAAQKSHTTRTILIRYRDTQTGLGKPRSFASRIDGEERQN